MSPSKKPLALSQKEKEETLKKFRKLIYQQAWKFHRRSGVPYEEILSEGYLCFCESLNRYRPERGAFSTFLWVSLSNSLMDFIHRWNRLSRDESLPSSSVCSEWSHCSYPDNGLHFQDLYKMLSSEAQVIATIIINHPQDFFRSSPPSAHALTPKAVRGTVFRHLRKQGWSWPKIWRGMNEVKMALK